MRDSFLTKNTTQDAMSSERRAKNAFNISVATAIIFSLIVLTIIISNFINQTSLDETTTITTVGLGAVMSIASAILSRRSKSDVGIILVISTLMLIVIGRVFIQKGFAIPSGLLHVLLVSSIAITTLPQKWVGRVISISFIIAISTIIIDQFTVGVPSSSDPALANSISLIIGFIYIIILGSQYSGLPLRTKLIIGFLLLTIMPLAILGWQTSTTSREILQQQIKAGLTEESFSVGRSLKTYIDAQFDIMRTEAALPDIAEYMAQVRRQNVDSEVKDRAYKILTTLGQKNPDYIRSYVLINMDGVSVLDTNSINTGFNYANEEFYQQIIAQEKSYLSEVIFPSETPGSPVIYFAVPVFSKAGTMTGVMLATYNANVLQSILRDAAEDKSTASEYTFLVDDTYFINLGHSSRPEMLFKSSLEMDTFTLSTLQMQGVMNNGSFDSLVLPQPELTSELKRMGAIAYFKAPVQEYNGEIAEIAAIRIPDTHWILVVAQLSSGIETLTQNQTRTIVISSVIISLISAVIAIIASNIFTSPIIQLTRAAETIASGDFTKKTNIKQKDEIGILARTFNNMADQIQESIENLERRVDQRTNELQQANKLSEKRAQELQTIAEISRYISTEKDLANLLPLITRIVSERFGFYHAGIFLLDENRKFAVLRAANSPGGQEMLEIHHRLEVGHTGIVGNVTASGTPRVALDTDADSVYFSNKYLPDTRSEMALPLIARGTIIGALDVQSTMSNAFTDADVAVLSLLADQIAIAIDNVRLLEETKNALTESQSIFRGYLAEAWQKKTSDSVIGYHQSISGGSPITDPKFEPVQNTEAQEQATIAIPIRVRDQVIGVMNIRANTEGKTWEKDDIGVMEAVAERIGLALDNARLFEETSSRASRERLVSDITTKIRGTNDPQEMIKTAMEELQRVLGATRVEIVPQKISPPPDK